MPQEMMNGESQVPGDAPTHVWEAARRDLAHQVDECAADRRLMVLYALVKAGCTDELTPEEMAEVEKVRARLDASTEAHPGLGSVIGQIGNDRDDFMACWERAERPARVFQLRSWRMAAVIAAIGFTSILSFWLLRGDDLTQFAVVDGASEQLELPDGSMLQVVGPASIRYDADDFDRNIELEGRAFLDVEHAGTTFTVHTDQALVTVLGTRFGVSALGNVTNVVLESGSVAVASEEGDAPGIVLTPGMQVQVREGEAPSPAETVDVGETLAWTGYVFFSDTPLKEAAQLLTRTRETPVTVHVDLSGETVTGSFGPDWTLLDILETLALTMDAVVTETAGAYLIAPAE